MNVDIPLPMSIAGVAGMFLSATMTLVPRLNVWWARLSKEAKQGIMSVLIILAGIGSTIWGCWGESNTIGICAGSLNWKALIASIFAALIVNQPTKQIIPEPAAVKEAKAQAAEEKAASVVTGEARIDRDSFMRP